MTSLPLHEDAAKVKAALNKAGVDSKVLELSASTHTSQEAASALGTGIGQIAKSIVFKVGDDVNGVVLVIASGSNRVAVSKLEALLNKTVRKANAELVKAATGFPIGGVPPLGHDSPIQTIIDADLMTYDTVWAAAGTSHSVFNVTPVELVRITAGQVADIAERIES